MIESFLLMTLVMTLPMGMAFFLLSGDLKRLRFLYFPLAIAIHLVLLVISLYLTRSVAAPGWTYTLVSVFGTGILALLLVFSLARAVGNDADRYCHQRSLWLCALLALVAVADVAWVLGKQGYDLKGNHTYFSHPFESSAEKDTILINALVRRASSPFLIHSALKSPTAWHYLASAFVAPLSSVNNFPIVMGVALATGLFFYFALLWALTILQPGFSTRPILAFVVTLLLATHADVFHFVGSLLVFNRPGLESDATFLTPLFRNFSLKLLCLTASPETLFFALLSVFWAIRHCFKSITPSVIAPLEFILLLGLWLCSTTLSLIIIPAFLVVEAVRHRKSIDEVGIEVRQGAFFLFALMATWALTRVFPVSAAIMPFRSEAYLPLWQPVDSPYWLAMPLLWLGSSGLIGGALTLVSLTMIWKRKGLTLLNSTHACLFFLGGLVLHYGVTSPELRRQFAMVASVLAPFILCELSLGINLSELFQSAWIRFGGQTLILVAASLHLYFLYAHTGRPSLIEANLPWKDYFQINALIEEKHPNLPVVAAIEPASPYPVVMEATTSFASTRQAALAGPIANAQVPFLARVNGAADIASYAQRLGYQGIVWGPIENRRWGSRIRERFISPKRLMGKAGSVELYALGDNLRDAILEKAKPDSAEFHFAFAEALGKKGFTQESLDEYYEVINREPNHPKAHNSIGLMLAGLGHTREAAYHFSKAIEIQPRSREAYNNLGAMWILQQNFPKAIEVLTRALKIGEDAEVYINLGHAYLNQNDTDTAILKFKRALAIKVSPTARLQALSGLGDSYARQGDFKKAVVNYGKVISANTQDHATRVKLGNALAYQGKTKEAIEQYNEVLKQNPRFEPARKALAALVQAVRARG